MLVPSVLNTTTQRLKQLGPILILGVGLSLLGVSGVHQTWRDRSLRLRAAEVNELVVDPGRTRAAAPQHIFIQWRVDTDITPATLQNGKWSIDPLTATYLVQAAHPGEGGNTVIYGHNTREILGNIRVLVPGEKITLTTDDGVAHQYEVEWTKEVAPTDVSAVQPTDHEALTLFTCSGLLDSMRFVVRARPI